MCSNLNWKQFKYPLVSECIDKLWYVHAMEYYSEIKRNIDVLDSLDEYQIVTFSILNIKAILLTFKSYANNSTYCMISFI